MDRNDGRSADFKQIKSAHDSTAVAAGDTLYVAGSEDHYSQFTITKPLVIIGPGNWLSQNPNTQANILTVNISTLNIEAAGTIIKGIVVTSQLNINASNITIKNCWMSDLVINREPGSRSLSNGVIMQNYVHNRIAI